MSTRVIDRRSIRRLIIEEISRCSSAKSTSILVDDVSCNVSIADDENSRNTGLMFRHSMPENHGMLFVFPDMGARGFWMKNTLIPLSIAFIDNEGYITNIEDMVPHDMQSKYSKGPAQYALEMNSGWFVKNGIGPGSKVRF